MVVVYTGKRLGEKQSVPEQGLGFNTTREGVTPQACAQDAHETCTKRSRPYTRVSVPLLEAQYKTPDEWRTFTALRAKLE